MALLDIVIYQQGVETALTRSGADITVVTDEVRAFLDDLADTMYMANGVGLAANQVGDLRRICVIDTTEDGASREAREGLLELINPHVVERSGDLVWEEGCLSFPELFEEVKRSEWVKVEALNRKGERFTIEAEGLLSVALQHEIDHLDGVLFLDRISRLRRRMALKRFKRIRERLRAQGDERMGGEA